MSLPTPDSVGRREFARLAVAAGGMAALSACLEEDDEPLDVPSGTDDPASLPERQHAWNESLSTDADGNILQPEHHVYVPLTLETSVDDDTRSTVEAALQTLERALEWSNAGLVFTIGYTPSYFDRFDGSLPESVGLPDPEPLTVREAGRLETDTFDALLHLASDSPEVVLATEEALVGEIDTLNGEPVETDLSSVFARVTEQRRTGFIGAGLPAEHTDVPGVPDSIPEEAPFLMGFRSGFLESQATEDRVTIEEGPFSGSTTQHISSMELQLEQWFLQDSHEQRVAKLFSPEHASDDLVGEIGEALGTTNGLTDERIAATEADARAGTVGHAQKAARAREDGQPLLLRRDISTVDGDRPGVHFLALQARIDDFVRVREAMTGADLPVSRQNNGILHYIFVDRRGNYLVPPRSLRALPSPDGEPTNT